MACARRTRRPSIEKQLSRVPFDHGFLVIRHIEEITGSPIMAKVTKQSLLARRASIKDGYRIGAKVVAPQKELAIVIQERLTRLPGVVWRRPMPERVWKQEAIARFAF